MIDKTDIKTINEFAQPIRLIKLRIALRQLGLFNVVDATIKNSGDDNLIDWWERGDNVDFLSDRILQLKESLGISDEFYIQLYYLSMSIDIDNLEQHSQTARIIINNEINNPENKQSVIYKIHKPSLFGSIINYIKNLF